MQHTWRDVVHDRAVDGVGLDATFGIAKCCCRCCRGHGIISQRSISDGVSTVMVSAAQRLLGLSLVVPRSHSHKYAITARSPQQPRAQLLLIGCQMLRKVCSGRTVGELVGVVSRRKGWLNDLCRCTRVEAWTVCINTGLSICVLK